MINKIFPLFLLFCFYSAAQEKIPFIDYDSIAEKVSISLEDGDYEKTLSLLNQINKNDSTHCSVMVSKSYYLTLLKRFDEAVAITDHGLATSCYDDHSSFYVNKVFALLKQDKSQEALDVCEEGLKRFPQNKTLWYNKAVSLETAGKLEEASKAYQRTILLDPYYKKPYLQLGNICYKQHLISQALMCYNMYLLLEPDADNALSILKSLNSTVQSKNEQLKDPDIRVSEDDEAFEEIDLIIKNRIALSEKYDTGNEIDIALTRQNHALIASLKDFSGNGGFWDTKFVPYYRWVADQNLFDAFTYTLSYSAENETYSKVIEKKIEEIQEFFDLSKQKWAEIVKHNVVQKNGKEQTLTYYFDDGYVKGIGETKDDVLVGPWELFNSNGRLTAKGTFNSNGNRDGTWVWYNTKGNVKESAEYVDGKLNGKNTHYYDNGKQKILSYYKNDELEGEHLFYNENGALQQRKNFKAGKLDGSYETYHGVGKQLLKSKGLYVDGKITDQYKEYFPTGSVSSEISFKDGKASGRETKYYLNEVLGTDLISKNGYVDGYYKLFHSNGIPKEIGQTSEGNYVGPWKTYYSTNTVESEFNYSDTGKVDGEYKFYDKDGKLNFVFEYRKGEFIAFKFYNKKGEVIGENRKKGGEFYYKGYSPYGQVASEGMYDIKGGKKGKWKYYTSNGLLSSEVNYNDNLMQGKYRSFHPHGALESIAEYRNDTLNGYYVSYHKNGAIKRQGWYKNDKLHGEWRSYTPDGIATEINFYHKGSLHGTQQMFTGNGVKARESHYEYDEILTNTYYRQDGSVSSVVDYRNNEEKYELVFQHQNKKPSTKISYVNGVKHGPYTYLNFYGKKGAVGQYLNGKLHGVFTWYDEEGNIETKANYIYGELDGDYIYYNKDGSIESEYYYTLDKLQKDVVSYHKNGNIKSKTQYYDDERHGRRESYGPSGKLQLIRFYEHGRLIGFSYLDKNSEELPMIALENESGKIVAYYDNEKISMEMEYKNSVFVDVFKEYYYSGELLEQSHYAKGEAEGMQKEYFPNGKLKKETPYELGYRKGIVKEYFENGNLKKEETYLYDVREGPTRKYKEDGKLLVEEIYFDGEIISSTSD